MHIALKALEPLHITRAIELQAFRCDVAQIHTKVFRNVRCGFAQHTAGQAVVLDEFDDVASFSKAPAATQIPPLMATSNSPT